MRSFLTLGVIAAVSLAAAGEASASEVYFNGVRITGLTNRKFTGCSVRFDAKGNIYITAPGYTVQKKPDATKPGSATKAAAALTNQYYLVSAGEKPERAQYDVDVWINDKWIKKIRANSARVLMKINRYLVAGTNKVQFTATKSYGGKGRLSQSSKHYLRVLVGIGTIGGGTITINRTLADFSAAANRTDNHAHRGTFTAR